LLVNQARNTNTTGAGYAFQACGSIDAIAEYFSVIFKNFTKINANPDIYLVIIRQRIFTLDGNRADSFYSERPEGTVCRCFR